MLDALSADFDLERDFELDLVGHDLRREPEGHRRVTVIEVVLVASRRETIRIITLGAEAAGCRVIDACIGEGLRILGRPRGAPALRESPGDDVGRRVVSALVNIFRVFLPGSNLTFPIPVKARELDLLDVGFGWSVILMGGGELHTRERMIEKDGDRGTRFLSGDNTSGKEDILLRLRSQRRTIFELHGLGNSLRRFIMEQISGRVHDRVVRQHPGEEDQVIKGAPYEIALPEIGSHCNEITVGQRGCSINRGITLSKFGSGPGKTPEGAAGSYLEVLGIDGRSPCLGCPVIHVVHGGDRLFEIDMLSFDRLAQRKGHPLLEGRDIRFGTGLDRAVRKCERELTRFKFLDFRTILFFDIVVASCERKRRGNREQNVKNLFHLNQV